MFDERPKIVPQRRPAAKASTASASIEKQARLRLKQLLGSESRADLLWWYDVGEQLAVLYPPGEKRRYRQAYVPTLAKSLVPGSDRRLVDLLYRARDIATRYSREEIERISTLPGTPLSALHVSLLASIEDKRSRDRFIKRCVGKGWSTRELALEIQNALGGPRKRGRYPIRVWAAKAPAVALSQIVRLSKRWMLQHGEWFVGKEAALVRIGTQGSDAALANACDQAREELEHVAEAVATGQGRLNQLAEQLAADKAREVDQRVSSRTT